MRGSEEALVAAVIRDGLREGEAPSKIAERAIEALDLRREDERVAEESARYCEEIRTGERRLNGELWSEHVRRACEPESRTTGLHRDSMG